MTDRWSTTPLPQHFCSIPHGAGPTGDPLGYNNCGGGRLPTLAEAGLDGVDPLPGLPGPPEAHVTLRAASGVKLSG